MKRLTDILAVVLTCGAIALSADLFRTAGLSLYTEQYLAGLCGAAFHLLESRARLGLDDRPKLRPVYERLGDRLPRGVGKRSRGRGDDADSLRARAGG